jgi:membrane-bound ClpP family serine protease
MIGEVGTVRSPVGLDSEGWVFVHGERWRAVLAFASEQSETRDEKPPVIEAGRKVAVVGFGDGSVEVVPVDWSLPRRQLDSTN